MGTTDLVQIFNLSLYSVVASLKIDRSILNKSNEIRAYADDIVLVVSTVEALREMVMVLVQEFK